LAENHLNELENLNKLRNYFQPPITQHEAANTVNQLIAAGYVQQFIADYVGVAPSTITYLKTAGQHITEELWPHIEEQGWALQKTYFISFLPPEQQLKVMRHEQEYGGLEEEGWKKFMGFDKYGTTPIQDGDLVGDSIKRKIKLNNGSKQTITEEK